MIPVHNLTENEYVVRVGDDFINVEFTKISCDIHYKYDEEPEAARLPFVYKENRGKTCDFDFTEYIDKNVPQRKVKSSLASVIDQASALVKKQRIISYGAIIAAFLAIATLLYSGYQLTISATSIIDDARERIDIAKKHELALEELQKYVNALQHEINELKKNIRANEQSTSRKQTEGGDEKSKNQIKATVAEAEK
jgi:cell division protein FtsB